jgi:hypothetical protein
MVLAKKLIFVHEEATFSWEQYCFGVNRFFEVMITEKVPNMEEILKDVPHLQRSIGRMSDRVDMLSELKRTVETSDKSEWPPLVQVADRLYKVMSKDPRDQIYALLGLACDGTSPELKPDYAPSVTYADVMKKVLSHSLNQGRLHSLLGAGLSYRYEHDVASDLPSWIPIFPKPMRKREGNWALDRAQKTICQVQYTISTEGNELSLQGVLVDEVNVLCPVSMATPPGKFHEAYKRENPEKGDLEVVENAAAFLNEYTMSRLEKIPELLEASYELVQQFIPERSPGGMDRNEAYWRAMVMDWDGIAKGGNTPASQETRSLFMDMREAFIYGDTESGERMMEVLGDLSHGSNFEKLFNNHWGNYDFAITKNRRMAWLPQGSRPGDVLCFFRGLDLPMVLRPTDEARERFLLIGDGYIQGLMHGKAKGLGRSEKWLRIV